MPVEKGVAENVFHPFHPENFRKQAPENAAKVAVLHVKTATFETFENAW